MKNRIIKGFTLVELIIVITILSILSTIAFVNFGGYIKKAEDSKNLANLKSIEKAINIFQIKSNKLPLPEDYITINNNGKANSFQGYIKNGLTNSLNISNLDGTYVYTVTSDLKYFQIGTYLNSMDYFSYNSQSYADENLDNKYFFANGNEIGILLKSNNSFPDNDLDISNYTGETLIGYLSNNNKIEGTGNLLTSLNYKYSCKRLLEVGNTTNGTYKISPDGVNNIYVYCDMENGGWTKINTNLVGNELGEYYTSSITNKENSAEILVDPSSIGCGEEDPSYYGIEIGNQIKWENIKFTQEFTGGNSCWDIFGYPTEDNIYTYNPSIDNISNQYKMNTDNDNIFDGISHRCDNNYDNNFWHTNKGGGLKYATVTLRKQDLDEKALLYTKVSCTNSAVTWTYKDIYIK